MDFTEIISLFQTDVLFQFFMGIISLACFSRIYFLITRGTGKIFFFLGAIILSGLFVIFPNWLMIISPILLGLWIIVEFLSRRKQIPFEKIQTRFEGGGTRRGLTPPEVAIVLGKPYHLIIVIAIVYLLEKKILILDNTSGEYFSVIEKLKTYHRSLSHKDRSVTRRQEARNLGKILHAFEELFLELFEQGSGKPIQEYDFGILVKPWLEDLSYRIGGYDLEQTRDYYNLVIKKQKEISWLFLREDWRDEIIKSDIHPKWLSENDNNPVVWFENLLNALKDSMTGQDFNINLSHNTNQIASTLLDDIAKVTYSVSRK